MNKEIIAIDFDGTIVEHAFPDIGQLRPGAYEVINALYAAGYIIIIWTCRTNIENHHLTFMPYKAEDAANFLTKEGINFHAINENLLTSTYLFDRKIYADIYIDDRQLGGIGTWAEIENILRKHHKLEF